MKDIKSDKVRAKRDKLIKDKAERTLELLRLKDFRCRRNAEVKRCMMGIGTVMRRPQLLCNSPWSILRGKWSQHLTVALFMNRCIESFIAARCRQISHSGMLQCKFEKIFTINTKPSLVPLTITTALSIIKANQPSGKNRSLALVHALTGILATTKRLSRLWTVPIAVTLGIVRLRKLKARRDQASILLWKFLRSSKEATILPKSLVSGLHAIRRLQRCCKRFLIDRRLLRDSVVLRWDLLEIGTIREKVLQSHRALFNREFSRINAKPNPRFELKKLNDKVSSFSHLFDDCNSDSKIYEESLLRIYKVGQQVRDIAVDVIMAARRKVLASIFIDQAAATIQYEKRMRHYTLVLETFELIGIPIHEKPPKRTTRSFVNQMIPTRVVRAVMKIVYSDSIRALPIGLVEEALRFEVAHLPKDLWGHEIRL